MRNKSCVTCNVEQEQEGLCGVSMYRWVFDTHKLSLSPSLSHSITNTLTHTYLLQQSQVVTSQLPCYPISCRRSIASPPAALIQILCNPVTLPSARRGTQHTRKKDIKNKRNKRNKSRCWVPVGSRAQFASRRERGRWGKGGGGGQKKQNPNQKKERKCGIMSTVAPCHTRTHTEHAQGNTTCLT